MSNSIRSILIPTDFSPAAWKAMQIGLRIGQVHKAQITVLHIFPVSRSGEEPVFDHLNKVKTNMEKLSNDLSSENGQHMTTVVISGNVNEALIDYVQRNHFDLVIMGVNSNGSDNNPGTHTVGVISRSKVPVLVVPNNYSLDD